MQREAQRDEQHHYTRNEHRKISPKVKITNEEYTRVITPTMQIGTWEMNSMKQHSAAVFVQNPTTIVGTVGTESPLSALNVMHWVIKQNIVMDSTSATTTTPTKVTPLIIEGASMKDRLIPIICVIFYWKALKTMVLSCTPQNILYVYVFKPHLCFMLYIFRSKMLLWIDYLPRD